MAIDTYEQALVHAAKHGNQTAFSELYESYYAKVYALARMTLQNDHDAEDALQAAFIKAWQSLPQLADNGAFNTWLQRITVNECYSMLRRRTPEPMEDERLYAAADDERAAELLLPEDYAQREDLRQRLWAIIQSLSQVQRQSIVLFYYDQLTVEQIAQVMDCSPGTVKSRLYLARRAIRTEIEEQERRSGQSFYGAATLPLGQLLVRELDANALPKQTALGILQQILASAGGAAAAGAAVSASAGALAGTAVWKLIGAIALGAAILVGAGLGIRHLTRRAEPAQTEPEPSLSLSFPDQTAPSAEPAPDPAPAYRGYLELLYRREDAIKAYPWYPQGEDNAVVSFCDLDNDGIEEMLYVDVPPAESMQSRLHIVGWDGDAVVEHYARDWDYNAGSGMRYCVFTYWRDETRHLCLYTIQGDEWTEEIYERLDDPTGSPASTELLRYEAHPGEVVDAVLQYERIWHVGGLDAEEDAYDQTARELRNSADEVLMKDPFGASRLEGLEQGSTQLTWQQAVDYLTSKAGPAPAEAAPSAQSMDPSQIPQREALERFLDQFAFGYRDRSGGTSYDCTRAADGSSNILAQIVSSAPCVSFRTYPGPYPEEHWDGGSWQWADVSKSYTEYDRKAVDWIAVNIFNVPEDEINALIHQGYDETLFYCDGVAEGEAWYYAPLYGVGGPQTEVVITACTFDGTEYAVTYDYGIVGFDERTTHTAVLRLKTLDGTDYWSLYRHDAP